MPSKLGLRPFAVFYGHFKVLWARLGLSPATPRCPAPAGCLTVALGPKGGLKTVHVWGKRCVTWEAVA